MSHADFVHLRFHSAYSLSEGAIHIKDLATYCVDERMLAVAIADANNLFGVLEFSSAVGEKGVQQMSDRQHLHVESKGEQVMKIRWVCTGRGVAL